MKAGMALMDKPSAAADGKTQPVAAPLHAAQATPPGRAAVHCTLAAVASGVLMWLCFHPVAWGFLGWIALAPLLVLVRTQVKPSLVYLMAFVGGVVFFTPALSWMSVAHSSMVGAWIALSVYCALYFPIAIALVRVLDRRGWPLVLSAPLVLVALEFVRCHFLTGFPWYLLAHTQHNWLTMIQITDLGGVFLVSLLVAAVNAIAFDVAYQFVEVRRWFNLGELEVHRRYASVEVLNRGPFADWTIRRNLVLEVIAVALVLIGTYVYGIACLRHDRFATGPTVCLLQSNLDQRLREGIGGMKDADQAFQTVESHFADLCVRATTKINPKPDLVIWPETSFPRPWIDVAANVPAENVPTRWRDASIDIRKALKEIGGKHTKVPHLIGMNTYCLEADGKDYHYNSAILLNADGEVEPQRFDKIHRVPFGEYIPLKDWLPFLAALSPYEGDFGVKPGEKMTRFEIRKHRFGVLICYEDTDPFLARRYVEDNADGPPVDFLVNISNDGWFDGSAEHEEHLAVSRFRAIECRRSMVRAVNMGVSAIIDPNGRVMKPVFYEGSDAPIKGSDRPSPPVFILKEENGRVPSLQQADWRHFKKRQLVIAAPVPIDNRTSLYAMTGDVLPIGCWAALIGTIAWSFVRRRQAKPLAA